MQKRTKDSSDGRKLNKRFKYQRHGIERNETGILVTAPRGKERACINEIMDVLEQTVNTLWPNAFEAAASNSQDGEDQNEVEEDLEKAIARELDDMKKKPTEKKELLTPIMLDIQCVFFVKTRAPIDPVKLVESICEQGKHKKMTRFTQRLTPITKTTGATFEDLESLAETILAPHFSGEENAGKKFAIQADYRNHNTLPKVDVIRSVAKAVGPGHHVDLKNYDTLILVQVVKNIIGMSVVQKYRELKRFNLNELYQIADTEGNAQEKSTASKSVEDNTDAKKDEPEKKTEETVDVQKTTETETLSA
ncbi:tRNA acetyltransferase [Schizosaccharomyces japonicus yFS275]|uniref:tRNA acetyltransferase n=1 Tax=Schizosaccharomyces japonicus (strain yFS275 / FY16936) TaxID=402676 RepID=B6JYH6_SCHJY|nr:tRNA acetyltransferase [Schizosaccharomyces japonicus yFS275]EEB06594.2 tRNA acetyltransferase [Schizosaccharomyces japonicus yFS275]